MGKCHLDRFLNKSQIGVSIAKKIINQQMIYQIYRAKKVNWHTLMVLLSSSLEHDCR
jgi:hypothetical protein